jgi:hypothetical protein
LAATPRFQRPTVGERDDIDTSFDDYDDSPVLPQSRVSVRQTAAGDILEDEQQSTSPLQNRRLPAKATAQQPQLGFQDFDSPAPASKKRKVLPLKIDPVDPVIISSSPEPDEGDDLRDDNDFVDPQSPRVEDDSGDSLAEDVLSHSNHPSAISRFKAKIPALEQVENMPRSTFKAISRGDRMTDPGVPTALPDIFSPSKRKGKQDYVPGGSADLVRSWVLNIAAQESQAARSDEHVVSVVHSDKDSSGRFTIILDENGKHWLLPHQQSEARGDTMSSLERIRAGCQILFKGHATRWKVPVACSSLHEVTVAAYWDFLQ